MVEHTPPPPEPPDASSAVKTIHPPLVAVRKHVRAAALLASLMILSALSEGIGIVLLVPMLGAIDGGGLVSGRVARTLTTLHLPLAITPLLALFVAIA